MLLFKYVLGNAGQRRSVSLLRSLCLLPTGIFPILRLNDGESVADAISPHLQHRPSLVPLGLFSAGVQD